MSKPVNSATIQTSRLRMHYLQSGPANGIPVLFVHGNASSGLFWKSVLAQMPENYCCYAPDLRGYGDTEDLRIDATRGLQDFIDDLLAFNAALGIKNYHAVGHSMGGSVLYGLVAAEGSNICSVTLVNPGSPYGFGGTKDEEGHPCMSDFAGSGGGIVNPQFAKFIQEKYRGTEDPLASPRVVMNNFYWKPPFVPANEEELLDSLLSEKIGPDRYPGDYTASSNYPFAAPGVWGPANALSPKYLGDSVARFINCADKAPILWIRGAEDQIVSDNSLFCMGTLGKLGLIPGYPGEALYPPQPMVRQTRTVLEKYAAAGGHYQEIVMEHTGHTPFVENENLFLQHLLQHLTS